MAIGLGILMVLVLISFLPFLALGLANLQTEFLRYSLGPDKPPELLPLLVRLHAAEVRDFRVCLCFTLGCLLVLFGLPLLVVRILWPAEIVGVFGDLAHAVLLLTPFAICRVLMVSPDPTGGLPSKPQSAEV